MTELSIGGFLRSRALRRYSQRRNAFRHGDSIGAHSTAAIAYPSSVVRMNTMMRSPLNMKVPTIGNTITSAARGQTNRP